MELNQINDMYQVFISGYRLANVTHGKPYYVYTVEIVDLNNEVRYLIEKRYSEFNTLHHMLKKDCDTAAPFPPKRVRNSNPKVLKHRRAALEVYIQNMLKLANTKQQVLNFLGIGISASETYHKSMLNIYKEEHIIQASFLPHHPVLTFHCDPYVHVNKTKSLPDIVTNGAILGIYKT